SSAPLQLPASFPEGCTVEIVSTEGGRTLVGAIELISPGNKDRESKRRQFAAKCATYLARGVGLGIVDVVTSRPGNLHNEMSQLLGHAPATFMRSEASLYAAAYRPLHDASGGRIDTWPLELAVGQPLPRMPLSLGAELCIPVELEASYQAAR